MPPQLDAWPQRDALRTAVLDKLEADRSVRYAPQAAPGARQALSLHVAVDPQSPAHLHLQLRDVDDLPRFEAGSDAAQGEPRLDTLLRAFDAAWLRLTRLRVLEQSDSKTLRLALRDADPQVRGFAIEHLGMRRDKASVTELCDLLASEGELALVLRAVGALVHIGDRRAVGPLIELTRRKDPGFVLQLVFAIGALGGRTAEGYLVTLAGGYPDDQVRNGAREALGSLAPKG